MIHSFVAVFLKTQHKRNLTTEQGLSVMKRKTAQEYKHLELCYILGEKQGVPKDQNILRDKIEYAERLIALCFKLYERDTKNLTSRFSLRNTEAIVTAIENVAARLGCTAEVTQASSGLVTRLWLNKEYSLLLYK